MGITGDNLYVGVMAIHDSKIGDEETEKIHAATVDLFKNIIVGDING